MIDGVHVGDDLVVDEDVGIDGEGEVEVGEARVVHDVQLDQVGQLRGRVLVVLDRGEAVAVAHEERGGRRHLGEVDGRRRVLPVDGQVLLVPVVPVERVLLPAKETRVFEMFLREKKIKVKGIPIWLYFWESCLMKVT